MQQILHFRHTAKRKQQRQPTNERQAQQASKKQNNKSLSNPPQPHTPATHIDMSAKEPANPVQLLEEDDEFEEFATEEWGESEKLPQDAHIWEDDWDDDNMEDDFSKQLKEQLAAVQQKS
ncbi:hypothetical protein PTSG_02573 [Salpingoeca rosetta]|uniref:26S proteasome complex subunit DSS1 n=1 Tax=Salpingoeca rosetta (strain ATCC 50818 / BSB-021) TaxID=946362 RepID=F2U2P3_SALR5|nr:uncharacterized protein PTSG_02573 [Salpingoeca rosetta]EGD81887.1 hypothetical protein PTSG_02573 [Salpingoeca rosetta]|eukprot:XP_004996070.1 hypothetical protein PTSG_02573 [Salpingoeca rosetta]